MLKYIKETQDLIVETLQKLNDAPMDRKEVSKIEVFFVAVPLPSHCIGHIYVPKISITFKE